MDRGRAHVRFAFDNELSAPRRARNEVASLFAASDPIADAVLLVVSELVSNVVNHTEGGGVLKVWRPGAEDGWRVEVEDSSTVPLVVRGEVDIGGNGLLLVDRLAGAWGFSSTAHGKVVWAELGRLGDHE